MFSCRDLCAAGLALTLAWAGAAAQAAPAAAPVPAAAPLSGAAGYAGIGRAATDKEIRAWNIDVRPDFQGLPKGSGTVAAGQDVWESKCASCHGVFGESREVFSPIVGGTTKDDVKTGRVARLTDTAYPERTTLMKLNSLSTLWDFINRAMPWTAPKSLSTDEVYAVVAYILNMGSVLPDDFTLSDRNMAEVQQRIPNRLGMTTRHGMWPGPELGGNSTPDVQGSACMVNCRTEPTVASFLPEFARNAHGNLAEQNRLVGPQRGADTTRPASTAPVGSGGRSPAPTVSVAPKATPSALAVLQRNGCVVCHGVDNKIVGPAFKDVAAKHGARADALTYLSGKIRAGGTGVWGAIPMPAQTLSDDDAKTLAQWLIDGAKK
jgi:S-disulfanyl-L-cysteine oxidoreductase SoxD